MNKNIKVGPLIIISYIVLLITMTYLEIGMERVIEVSTVFLLISFFVLFESKEMNSRIMCAVATLSALAGVLRVPFAVIPGFQPVTFIAAVSGYTLGPINGFMVGAMSAFISNFFLGHGPWTLWQIMAWGLCGVFFGIFSKIIKRFGFKSFIILCGIWAYIYGLILNQWYVLSFIKPITLKAIFSGNILSFCQDTSHALGNIMFASAFGKTFIEVLQRYNRRNKVIKVTQNDHINMKRI
ncbi:ECF transporter S component [Hathewaya histolytica]|uniref:Metal ion ABC transporter membrane-spanning subunit n=1 Tax=Hathewaya histolytica TaxID=1498 RepID=A0A4U9RGK5_HATHI|nr:ECF transporter S component [Hathewaya histolytica]VTQ91024.1 metal ion ABC transporter membrane-spanning subunit [Hathewaya histolytica]